MDQTQTNPPKKHGCFFYGCITSLIIFVLLVLATVLAIRAGIHKVNALIAQYTDTQPVTIAVEPLSQADMDALKKRMDDFQKGLAGHSNMPPLVLTGPELNAWLTETPATKDLNLKNHFHVALASNEIRGEVSVPLEKMQKASPILTWFDLKGRYLNGAGVFKVALASNLLDVSIDSLEVKGKPLPDSFMAGIRGQNMAAGVQANPTNAAAISRFESIEIKDGKLIVTPKQAEAQ